MGAVGAMALAIMKGRLKLDLVRQAAESTAKLSAFVVFILIGARGSDQAAHDGSYGPTEYEVEPSAGYSREPARSAPPQAGAWNQAPRPAQQSWAGNADYPPDDPGGPAFDNSPMEDNDVPF